MYMYIFIHTGYTVYCIFLSGYIDIALAWCTKGMTMEWEINVLTRPGLVHKGDWKEANIPLGFAQGNEDVIIYQR